MESVKKIIPFILIAVVFAVGGYFIGKGSLSNQSASLYRTTFQQRAGNPTKDPSGEPCIGGKGVTGDPCATMVAPVSGDGAFLINFGQDPLPEGWVLVYGSDHCWWTLSGGPDNQRADKVWCDKLITNANTALMLFQKSKGIPQTGKLDQKTQTVLSVKTIK